MRLIRILCGIIPFLIIFALLPGNSAFALSEGTYILPNITYYVNPDTGLVDDGGDTSTGEGMCRNATYPESLYEYKDGKHYVTIRLKLINFIKDIHFHVQQVKGDPNSYQEISYKVSGENTEENTKDFIIEVPSSDVLIKPEFFVGPMNRVVTYFIELNMDLAKEDKGLFAAHNDQRKVNEVEMVPESTVLDDSEKASKETAEVKPLDQQQTREDIAIIPSENIYQEEKENEAIEVEAGDKTGEEEILGITGFTSDGETLNLTDAKDRNKGFPIIVPALLVSVVSIGGVWILIKKKVLGKSWL